MPKIESTVYFFVVMSTGRSGSGNAVPRSSIPVRVVKSFSSLPGVKSIGYDWTTPVSVACVDVTSDSNAGYFRACAPHGSLVYCPNWLQGPVADGLLAACMRDIPWHRRAITLFGRELLQPRLISFQGDAGVSYRYSGGQYIATTWHDDVQALRKPLIEFVRNDLIDAVRPELEPTFNSVLINLYRDGQDSMGWHADDEKELGTDPLIASISLGAKRRFVLRHRVTRERFEIVPEHGSLIVMAGDLQHRWQHQVPKTARDTGPRINLTYRTIA